MKKIITLCLILVCLSFLSLAQNKPKQKGTLKHDINQDGKLDREEFNKRASQQVKAIDMRMDKTFDRIDANKDGFLDRSELRQDRAQRKKDPRSKSTGKKNMRPKANRQKMMRKKRPNRMGQFTKLDRNGNKLLTFREFKHGAKQKPNYSRAAAKRTFNRLDSNQDGLLEPREFSKAGLRKKGNKNRRPRMRGNRRTR